MLYNIDVLKGFKDIPDKSQDLIIADPPYYKTVKAEWDNQWKTEGSYLDWCRQWFNECVRVLKDTGSFYCYGNFDMLSKQKVFIFDKQLNFRQGITLNKGLKSIAGRTSSKVRLFPTASEYLLFYTVQEMTIESPYAKILKQEMQIKGIEQSQIQQLFPSKTGGLTGCVFNWLHSLTLPTRTQWEKICSTFNIDGRDYQELYKLYQKNRFTFNLPVATTDVWDFIPDKLRYGHPTQKPLEICQRIINASSNEGDKVLILFAGSGSECVACDILKRNWTAFENNRHYWEIANNRIKESKTKYIFR